MGKIVVIGMLLGCFLLGIWIARQARDAAGPLITLALRYVDPRRYGATDAEMQKSLPFTPEPNAVASMMPADQDLRALMLSPVAGERLNLIDELVALMHQFFPDGGDFQLYVRPDKGKDAVYVEGEKLAVHVSAETNAYLQVDYYQSDGKVVHLLPNPVDNNFVQGGKTLVLGNSQGGYQFIVSPPFGEELLTVIASQEPLQDEPKRPDSEHAAEYIEHLLNGLTAQKAKGQVAGAYVLILTRMP
jgi:hypothetical protein